MVLPPSVRRLVDGMMPGFRKALGQNLTGVYLCGSLALGDFDPESSDVDFLVVTERPMSDAELAALRELHKLIPPTGSALSALEYEVYYLDRSTLRRFETGQKQVKAAPDERLHRTEHRPSWVIERWVIREYGVILAGPNPKDLIDPVSEDELREAAASELKIRDRHWVDGTWLLEEITHLGAQGYEVETVCRALFTMREGKAVSKPRAVAWALETLPKRWRPLIEWSRTVRRDSTRDETRVTEVLEFLRWAAEGGAQ